MILYLDNKKFYNKLKLALKKNKVKFHNKQKNKGGRPPVDCHGEIAAKIKELKLDNFSDGNIPWEIRFTKFVQQMKIFVRQINFCWTNGF